MSMHPGGRCRRIPIRTADRCPAVRTCSLGPSAAGEQANHEGGVTVPRARRSGARA
ncbi:hypothetical protein AB0I55_10805 [Actinocatenispora sera]|uniref:hypothetical protein n=1 Tax=Actinocatenispora sera TaxID=390989 RepID=UPI0012ECC5B0|nr:hypothetical protein [Actinocatenispora sera]